MKATFASALAFIPILTAVSAFEIAEVYKVTLQKAECVDIHLTDGHVLHANCVDLGSRIRHDYELDLNLCFANFDGTLDHTLYGNFGASCINCTMNGTKLECDCGRGGGRGWKHNVFELNDWWTVQLSPGSASMFCSQNIGIEKRADGKEAKSFVA